MNVVRQFGVITGKFVQETGGRIKMKYVNGKDILPKSLLEQLQQFVQGELLYIPRQENSRAGWGSVNGTRMMIRNRNTEICIKYEEGASVQELMDAYHLSEDSIRKVLNNRKVLLAVE
jgi:Mor family transcriptional regulator